MVSSRVIEAIAVTAELCGRTFTPAAARVFAGDLEGFPDDAILAALARCRKEVKGLLTVQDVVSRVDDGRPGVEQAWAMLPHDENTSTVWTEEMAAAWGVAGPLMIEGDRVGARMAFKEAYTRAVNEARDQKLPPKWTPSFGRDVGGRQAAIEDAVRHKRLSLDHAVKLLPLDAAEGLLLSLGVRNHPLLAPPSQAGRQKVKELLLTMKSKAVA